MRVAIYARYSSDLQSPTSIDDQVRLCRAHADRQGWDVVATFEDAARSGFGVEHRPGYQQLLSSATATPRPFDVILVEDLSRLTRDMAEILRLYHRLQLKGVELVGVSDGIATGRQGAKVQIAVKGLVNELYLDDLRDKTHRGLSGRVERGFSAGGRTFGYRTVTHPGHGARVEIDVREAEIVRRIFRDYAGGRAMKPIAHALNAEGVPFPAKDTKRGPARRGWALSTIQVILQNEKYVGRWVWNTTRFLKDPETGRRRPVPRPESEWIRQERPDLRIVDDELWRAVQARLELVREAFGCHAGRRPRGRASLVYSPRLLSGLLVCGVCGARMVGQTFTRKKPPRVYTYSSYRCGFAAAKGPAVCGHGTAYRQDRLEGALLGKFRNAMTPAMLVTLTTMVNTAIDAAAQRRDQRAQTLKDEILRLEHEGGHLARFVATGGDSAIVREELRAVESALRGLRLELVQHVGSAAALPPRVEPGWVQAKLTTLDALLREDPARAKLEIAKHLDGPLAIRPLPSEGRTRRAEITGRVKANGLLAHHGAQEAVYAVNWLRGGASDSLHDRPLPFRFEVVL